MSQLKFQSPDGDSSLSDKTTRSRSRRKEKCFSPLTGIPLCRTYFLANNADDPGSFSPLTGIPLCRTIEANDGGDVWITVFQSPDGDSSLSD